jgi:hypothetical protein
MGESDGGKEKSGGIGHRKVTIGRKSGRGGIAGRSPRNFGDLEGLIRRVDSTGSTRNWYLHGSKRFVWPHHPSVDGYESKHGPRGTIITWECPSLVGRPVVRRPIVWRWRGLALAKGQRWSGVPTSGVGSARPCGDGCGGGCGARLHGWGVERAGTGAKPTAAVRPAASRGGAGPATEHDAAGEAADASGAARADAGGVPASA